MASVLSASWFYWAVGVAVGLPVLLVLLTEIQNALRRRNSYLARPVRCCAPSSCPWARCCC